MKPHSPARGRSSLPAGLTSFTLALSVLSAACASSSMGGAPAPIAMDAASMAPPSPDPRVGLAAGLHDAAEASWNLSLIATRPPGDDFVGATNSDLAFMGDYAIQGNYNGYQFWNVSDPANPVLEASYLCPASQSDVSVYRNLLFVSGESTSGRLDCGTEGVQDSVSTERLRGIRIFDISDIHNPKYVANVQTCRGSHTHTVVTDPRDPNNVYIYVSGSSRVRSPSELPGCSDLAPDEDPNSAHFRIEVIRVPLANPTQALIVTSPRIFNDLDAPPRHADPPDPAAQARQRARGGGAGNAAAERRRTGPDQCHDITVYPEIGLAGGACGGYGLLLDISDVANPRRMFAAADSNFSYWHSATFSNDGSKLLFTDEWGGGGQPRCRASDKYEWGADAVFTIENRRSLTFHSYFKMPAAQTEFENCVAHNGSLIPIPGREVMVQAWYQGGLSVFDWTDVAHPQEIAFYDRGPVDDTRRAMGGSWSAYWYNGYIYSSEIARGFDVYELEPNAWITQNEIDAAKTVHFDYYNTQDQRRFVWPATFSLARAYADQLQRSHGLSADRLGAIRSALANAEGQSGQSRTNALRQLSGELQGDAMGSSDAAKVRMLQGVVNDLASAM